MHQPGQIACKQLVLQRLGGGGDQHALAAVERGHQIGVGLAHASARLHHKHARIFNGLGHGQCHLRLPGTRAKRRLGLGQSTFWLKSGGNRIQQLTQDCVTFLASAPNRPRGDKM